MKKSIMISGPDGTGKSTIINKLHKELGFEIVWLRFHHYLSKIVNMIGRIVGKSYRKEYSWGKVGYHDYCGIFGVFYIFAVYIDHLLFKLLIKNRKFKKNKTYLVDRYILDVVADLIVDTKNYKMVFFLFDRLVRKELSAFDSYILECNIDIVIGRRNDIKDDKKYLDKINAYKVISHKYNINTINTGLLSLDAITQRILNK
jgi:hypothetical protein